MASKHNKKSAHETPDSEGVTSANHSKRKRDEQEDLKRVLKVVDWKQNNTGYVQVILLAGKKLSTNEIDVVYTDADVHVTLTDGRRFYCKFFRAIDGEASRVQLIKMRIYLKVKKCRPDEAWLSYRAMPVTEVSPNSSKSVESVCEQVVSQTVKSRLWPGSSNDANQSGPSSVQATSTSTRSNNQNSMNTARSTGVSKDTASASKAQSTPTILQASPRQEMNKAAGAGSCELPGAALPCNSAAACKVGDKARIPPSTAVRETTASAGDGVVTGVTVEGLEGDKQGTTETGDGIAQRRSVDEGSAAEEKEDELCYDLTHIKHDWYELGTRGNSFDTIMVHVYVKEVKKDSVKINFTARSISLKFCSQDDKFLQMHGRQTEETVFHWHVSLIDDIDCDRCKYHIKQKIIEFTLKKKLAQKWGALEASQRRSPVSPAAVNTWIPASPSTNLDPVQPDKSKVIFDEMGTNNSEPAIRRDTSRGTGDGVDTFMSSTQKLRIITDSSRDVKKPTCMVSPLHAEKAPVVTPGMTGLDNLGNTCFMNSVLQVLANTSELCKYFQDGTFQKELNADNPLGMGGKLAVSFAQLMKVLWSGKHYSYAPAKLKNLIAMKASQFTGFAQHDAQEFMAFLLDGLHEDLNRVDDKPYTQTVDSDGRPDEVVADEAWHVHKQRNDSFIVDLFQGQFKSKLVCPVCGKVSITFDPFMTLPVPLPKKQRWLNVIFMSKEPSKKPIKYHLQLSKDATVEQLKECVSQKTCVHSRDLRVYEVSKNCTMMFYSKGTSLANVGPADKIYVCEVLSEKAAGEPVLEIAVLQRLLVPLKLPTRCSCCQKVCETGISLKRCTRCYRTAYCNQHCQRKDWARHKPMCRQIPELIGQPFVISLPQSHATFFRLYQLLERFSRYSVDVFQPPVQAWSDRDSTPMTPSSTAVGPCQSNGCEEDSQSPTSEASPLTSKSFSALSRDNSLASTVSGDLSFTNLDSTPIESESMLPMNDFASTSVSDVSVDAIDNTSSVSISLINCDTYDNDNIGSVAATVTSSVDAGYGSATTAVGKEQKYDSQGSLGFTPGKGGDDNKGTVPMGYVMGRQQDINKCSPQFYLKPCDREGRNVSKPLGMRLEDLGDTPLNISNVNFLAMDWKNMEKCRPYVIVQSKNLEYENDTSTSKALEDESMDVTLDKCLSLFTEPEILSPEHAWYCPQCKAHREASKQLSIWRLPDLLIIQLKRFSFANYIWRCKIDKLVQFPITDLDMNNYSIGERLHNERSTMYELYGVINHHGGLLGGHYTAYARCPGTKLNGIDWRIFDDSVVSRISAKQVVTPAAYVLFYRRRTERSVDMPGPSPSLAGSSRQLSDDDSDDDDDCLEKVSLSRDMYGGGQEPDGSVSYTELSPASFTDMDAVD